MSNKSRRDFLRKSSSLLGGLAAHYLVAGSPLGSVVAQTTAGPRRPLRMLAVGDSVMWGQGLSKKKKFSYIVREELCKWRNGGTCADPEDVQLHVTAHSGANIFEKREDDKFFLRENTPRVYPGEVNFHSPTVPAQITLAVRHYRSRAVPPEEVDLVLLNGGINDMNNSIILIPRPFDGNGIEENANKYCGEKMTEALRTVASTFPNARIVVPSYFPLVSEQTPAATVVRILTMALPGGPRAARREAERLMSIQRSRAFRNLLDIPDSVQHPIRYYLAKRSEKWAAASSAALRGAVNTINSERPLAPSRAGASTRRAWFVQVPFGPERAYGTPTTYLWQLVDRHEEPECGGGGIAGDLQSNDELFRERSCMCEVACKDNDVICLRAGFMHPNKDGARAYADAILAVLRGEILPHTNWA